MGSIFSIGKALIKRNLRMTMLVGIIFVFCIAGMTSAFSIQMSTSDVFEKAAEKNKMPHMFSVYSCQILDTVKIHNFLRENPLVESYAIQPIGDFLSTKAQIGRYDDVMVYPEEYCSNTQHNRITISEGIKKDAPGLDEVWVPTGLAAKFNIKVGDKMYIKTPDGNKQCIVSAIVFDTWYSSTMSNPTRIWVRAGQLSLWSGLSRDENSLMSVRLKDINNLDIFKHQMDKAFPNLISVITVDYYSTKDNANLLNNIISLVLLAVSILLLAISAGIVFFVILGEVINDYTSLGVYKGLGFSNRQLKAFNYCRYFLLLLVTFPFGFGIGVIITHEVIEQYKKTAGGTEFQMVLLLPAIIALLVISLILFAAINLSMRKIKKLEPANAIRFGYVRKNKKVRQSAMLSNTSIDLAFREIRLNPLKSVIKSMIICIFALLMFSVGLVNSVMGEGLFTACTTIGMPDCNIFLQSNNMDLSDKGEEVVAKIKKIDGVKEIIPVIMSTNVFAVNGEEKISMLIDALDSFHGNADLKLLDGRNPENDYEAAVTSITLQQLGKKIGDRITMNIDGSESTYLITGSFQVISNDGKAARITKGAYLKANPNKDYNMYAVTTKEGADLKQVKQSIQRAVGGQITATIMSEFMENMIGSIETGFNMLCTVLIGILALICGASLINIIQLHMAENRRLYGIFKGIGISGSTINCIQYFKEFFTATLGIVAGLVLTVVLAPSMLYAIFSSTRLTEINYSFSVADILLRAGIVYLVVMTSVFMALLRNRNTKLRELIME